MNFQVDNFFSHHSNLPNQFAKIKHTFSFDFSGVRKHKTPLGANKRGFYFYSLTFRHFAGFHVIRPRGHALFFSKIFCLSVDTPARQRALLVTTGYLTVAVV